MSTFFEISGIIAWVVIILWIFPGPGLFLGLSWFSEWSYARRSRKDEG